MEIKTSGYKKTQDLGKIFAQEVLRKGPQKGAVVLALEGDLGGGKTTFAQGFAKGLGIKEKVASPTFVIFKKFKIRNGRLHGSPKSSFFENFYHFDCYRLSGEKDALSLGFEEIVSSPKNIVLLEWAKNIDKSVPQEAIWLKFDFVSKNKRTVILSENKESKRCKKEMEKEIISGN
ncbi:MAG: tRNA (adenosine(37)-N6)-threonylcarbamoyltransferase complex ATPase subunit type 1 TsaE [Candidatus Paceibacterota bacterium]|jgi:tRNA threonylcarbamoyladenosine biosynthesis protein TsaE